MPTSSASSAVQKPNTTTIDLAWVEFSEEEAEPCMSIIGCDKEATWKAVFKFDCTCTTDTWFFCEADGNRLKQESLQVQNGEGFCLFCGGPGKFISMTRFRGCS